MHIEAGDDEHAYLTAEGFWHDEQSAFTLEKDAVCLTNTYRSMPDKQKEIFATYSITIPQHFGLEIKM